MALKTANTAVSIALQTSGAGTFDEPTKPDDLMPVSQCRLDIQGVTIENDEYLGTIIRNAPDISGKQVTLAYNVKLRPPTGGSIPAANAFLLGRILQAAKYTELRTATAIPASAEALAGGSTTTIAQLSTGATGTADLYKGMGILLKDKGATFKAQLAAIRSYDASKNAELMETLGGTPSDDYQIPVQLGYMRSVDSSDPPLLSQELWIHGHRFDLMDGRVTGLQLVIPTSTKRQAAYPELQVTYDCTIYANAAETTPSVTPLGAVPLFRDGKMLLNRIAVGGSTFTIDNGLQTEDPPNPNQVEGVDAAELVGGTAIISMTRQKYLPSVIDTLALADAQAQHPFWAQWGSDGGSMVQIVVPDCRLNYPSPDLGGNLVNENGDLMIDAYDRGICINFPFGSALS